MTVAPWTTGLGESDTDGLSAGWVFVWGEVEVEPPVDGCCDGVDGVVAPPGVGFWLGRMLMYGPS